MKLVMKLSILLVGMLLTAVFMMSTATTPVVLASFTSTPTTPPTATNTPEPTATNTPEATPAATVTATATSPSDTGAPSQPSDPNLTPTPTPQGTAVPTPEAIPALGDGPGMTQISVIAAILFAIFVLLVIAWWKAWQMYKQ